MRAVVLAFAQGSRWLVIAIIGLGASYVLRIVAARVRARSAARLGDVRAALGLSRLPAVASDDVTKLAR